MPDNQPPTGQKTLSVDSLVRCARANTATGLPSLIVLIFLLVFFHSRGDMIAEERLICGSIGLILGWLLGLWACCFYLSYEATNVTQ